MSAAPALAGLRALLPPLAPLLSPQPDRIALAMWLKRLFGRGEKGSPSVHAPSTKETELGREDRQKEFMDEQVRERDEAESHIEDEPL